MVNLPSAIAGKTSSIANLLSVIVYGGGDLATDRDIEFAIDIIRALERSLDSEF